jgi:hypothetical protein
LLSLLQHYADAVLLGGDEVLIGRTVNAKTGVCLPLAQARPPFNAV